MCVGRGGYFASRLLLNTFLQVSLTVPTLGVDVDDSRVCQQDFCLARTQGDGHVRLQSREPLQFAPVAPAQASWQRAPRPPLGQGLGPDAPKNASWLQGLLKSALPRL